MIWKRLLNMLIAGDNVVKEDFKDIQASTELNGQNDLLDDIADIELGKDQYLGVSRAGMGMQLKFV